LEVPLQEAGGLPVSSSTWRKKGNQGDEKEYPLLVKKDPTMD